MVGWIPTVWSKSYLVAPNRIAAANPWVIYPAFGPIICNPTILLLSDLLTTSLA